MDSGDHSLLSPFMSIRDLVWIRTARNIRLKDETDYEVKRYKYELESQSEMFKQIMLSLADVRQCVFWTIEFDTKKDPFAPDKAWLSLPTMNDAGHSPDEVYLRNMSAGAREEYLRQKREKEKDKTES